LQTEKPLKNKRIKYCLSAASLFYSLFLGFEVQQTVKQQVAALDFFVTSASQVHFATLPSQVCSFIIKKKSIIK
jgi:hypothetical protein